MRYAIVATTGWLLWVDLQSRQVQPLEHSRPEYYGISWFPENDELVISHSGLDNANLIDIAGYAQSERGWLSKGDLSSRLFLSAPHQILCAPDNRVVCANTGRNVISIFDFKKPNLFQEAGISSARWDRLSLDNITGDHLNSVFLRDNHLYVVAHGHSKGSTLATFTYPDLQLLSVEPLGERTGLHNIWITRDGQRISCHSENGSLIDLDNQAPLWESGSAMYTRGLAATNEYVLVGESQKTGRDFRRSSLSGLWILDKSNWQAIDYLCLGPYGAVNEVRVLDEVDDAHHGHPFKGLESLITQDARLDLSSSRLFAAASAYQGKHIWTGYKAIFGSPTVLADGAKRALIDQLCLVVKQTPGEPKLAFAYTLETQSGSHVSAILGYRGEGGDRCMAALLLQPTGEASALSVWRHDGHEWSCLPDIQAHNLPASGEMQLVTNEEKAILVIDTVEIISLSAETLGIERCDRGLGIRWLGASVRPMFSRNE